jgi:putative SOS response-associated peptidase YedK
MCGRYTLHANEQTLKKAIDLALPQNYEPDYNIGPGRDALSIARRPESEPAASRMAWGLRTPQNFHINARLETADTSPRFRESWADYRCVLPANGFYEWYRDGVTKQPYYFYPRDQQLRFFAGLWFPSSDAEEVPSFVILTTAAQPAIEAIHKRMPVILGGGHYRAWLNGSLSKHEAHAAAQEVDLDHHTVSQRVNRVQNNDSQLIQATAPLVDEQMRLF